MLLAATLAAPVCVAYDHAMISLAGTPEQIGTIYGTINAENIRHDFQEAYLDPAYAAGLTDQDLLDQSATTVGIIEQMAPHWLTEARAIADAAGLDQDLYISYLDGVVRNRFLLPDCTSYAVSPDYTENGAVFFHKTRDNRDAPQSVYMVDSSLPDVNKFIAVSNANGIQGLSMMVNEKGLAGSADYPANLKSGVLPIDDPLESSPNQSRGLMSGAILRRVAEQAETCQEALDIVTECVNNGWYAGGDVGGNHWLFVDKNGDILEIRNNSGDVTSQWRNEIPGRKAYFSRFNDSPAADRLNDATEPIDFHDFHNVSRDPSICLGSSISGMTVEIDPDHPELFTTAWVSLPVNGVAFPILMGQTETPLCLLDGEAYEMGTNATVDVDLWESIEEAVHQEKETLVSTANPNDPNLAQTLNDWSQSTLLDVFGYESYWAGGAEGGTWDDPGNWEPGTQTVEIGGRLVVTAGTAGTASDDIVTVSPGSITLDGAGAAVVAHSLDASGGILNLAEGTLTVDGGTFKPAPGDYKLEPEGVDTVVIHLENQAAMDVDGYLRLQVGSTLNVTDSTVTADDFIGIGSATGEDPDGEGKLVVDGAGALVSAGNEMWIGGSGEIGRVTVRNGGRLEVGDYLGLAKSTWAGSTGFVEIDSGGSITVDGGDILIGTEGLSGQLAEMTLDGGGSALTQTGSGSLLIGAAGNSTGRVVISGGTCTTGSGGTVVEATGTLNLEGGTLNTPSLDHSHGGDFRFTGGMLEVKDFTGDLVNRGGVYAPGRSTAISSISGDYTQLPSGTIEMEIGGTVPGGGYDHLDIGGATTLGGTLDIVLTGGFPPSLNDTFDLFDYLGGIWGDFADYHLPDLEPGLAWDVTAVPTTGVLSVISGPLDGDLNGDGFVGSDDLNIVRSFWGQTVTAGDWAQGDPSGDGLVNSADLDVVRANWGVAIQQGGATVPEPSSLILLIASAAALLFARNSAKINR